MPRACTPRAARRTRSVRRSVWAAALLLGLSACSSDSAPDAPVAEEAPPATDQIETTGAGSEPGDSVATTDVPSTAPAEDTDDTTGADEAPPTAAPSDDRQPDVTTGESTDEPSDDPAVATTTPGVGTVVDGNLDDLPVPVPGPTVAGDLDEEVDYGTGVVASITTVEAVEVEARFPGERSGPGVVVSVEVDNRSSDPIVLDFVIVDLIRADGASAVPVELDVPSALSGRLAPGDTAVGRYQYFIPVDQRAGATITVSYAADVPTALFSGDLPDA